MVKPKNRTISLGRGLGRGSAPPHKIFKNLSRNSAFWGNFLQNFNTKFLVYYLIIPLKKFLRHAKGGAGTRAPLPTPLPTTGYCIIAFGKDTFFCAFLNYLL